MTWGKNETVKKLIHADMNQKSGEMSIRLFLLHVQTLILKLSYMVV